MTAFSGEFRVGERCEGAEVR